MLVNAMEISGIDGNFRITCVLRENRDSLVATLEAFVHDPLISWRLLNHADKYVLSLFYTCMHNLHMSYLSNRLRFVSTRDCYRLKGKKGPEYQQSNTNGNPNPNAHNGNNAPVAPASGKMADSDAAAIASNTTAGQPPSQPDPASLKTNEPPSTATKTSTASTVMTIVKIFDDISLTRRKRPV